MTHTTTLWARIGGGLVSGLIGFAIGPVLGVMLPGPAEVGRYFGMGAGLLGGAFLGAFMVGRSVVARWCAGTAFAVGGISFLAGFVGPILLAPGSPQGPLLGIFITGPLGFVVGAVAGLFIGLMKERRQHAQGPASGPDTNEEPPAKKPLREPADGDLNTGSIREKPVGSGLSQTTGDRR